MNQIKIESFLKYQYVSQPTFSPDGRFVAFVVQTVDEKQNRYQGDIHLLDTSTRQVRRLTMQGDAKGYTWTKQNTLLFSAQRGKKEETEKKQPTTTFYEISPDGGEALEAFCVPAKASGLLALDGDRYLLAAEHPRGTTVPGAAPAHEAYEVFDELPFWANGEGIVNGMRTGLYLFTRSAGKLDAITGPDFTAYSVNETMIDGEHLLFMGYSFRNMKCKAPGVYLYNLHTHTTECLIEPDTRSIRAAALWGERVLVAATEEGYTGGNRYPSFYVCDPATKQMELLASFESSVGGNAVNSDASLGGGRSVKFVDGSFYFTTTEGERSYVRRLDADGNISQPLTTSGACGGFDMREGQMVWTGFADGRLTELYWNNAPATDFNGAFLREHSAVTPISHKFTASDGYEIHGYMLPPVGYTPGKQYPAILHIHGGPRTVFGEAYHHEMQVWANAGYFVFYCNPRGSDGRGNAFGDISGKYGTVDYDNMMEFTDQMLRLYPDIDQERVGVTGGSYGGFMTNWMIGHTNRFAAAAAQRSISNWISMEHTSDIGSWFVEDQMATCTRSNVDKMWWHSPLKYADQAKTPTLFIQGDQDYRCWMVDALSMFTALKMHGVPARMCLFQGENHELSRSGKPQNRIRRMHEILSWMDQYLKTEQAGGKQE